MTVPVGQLALSLLAASKSEMQRSSVCSRYNVEQTTRDALSEGTQSLEDEHLPQAATEAASLLNANVG